jgi:hypothetical protein
MSNALAILTSALVVVATSQPSSSRGPRQSGDVQIRINGPVTIARDDTASAVLVINHDATIDGVVREGLGVVNGTARVRGQVNGGVVVVNGHLEVEPGAVIERDIMLYHSTITRANDAIINGVVRDQTGFSVGAGAIWLVWSSFTIVVVMAGVLFAEIAPVTLAESTQLLVKRSGQAALTALVVVAAVPALAFVSFATVIGIPLGLVLILVVIPALSFLGYLVTGEVVGWAIAGYLPTLHESAHRRASIALGLVTLQLAVTIPVVGGLIGFIASLLGAGALVAHGWSRRSRVRSAAVPIAVGA